MSKVYAAYPFPWNTSPFKSSVQLFRCRAPRNRQPVRRMRSLGLTMTCVFVLALSATAQDTFRSPTSRQATLASPSLKIPDCRITVFERVTVSAEQQGVLVSIIDEPGKRIERGQLVAQVKDDAARLVLETATKEVANDIDLRYAQKLSELSNLEYARAVQLNREIPNARSEAEVLRLKLAAERAALQVEQAAHQLELAEMRRREAQVRLDSYKVLAPIEGTVLLVHRRAGESVHVGDPMLELADFRRLRVEGFVSAADALRIRVGQSVAVRLADSLPNLKAPEVRVQGRVTFVDPVVNEVSQQVRIWAEVPNPQNLLRDGLIAEMEVSLDSQPASVSQTERVGTQPLFSKTE